MKKFLNFLALDHTRLALYCGILSGVLIGTTYIPFVPWALLFCYVPLFSFWLRTESPFFAFFAGWISQFILSIIGFHWIAHLAVEFGHLPPIVAWLVMIGFASFIHLHIPIFGALFVFLRKKLKKSPSPTPIPILARSGTFLLLPLVALSVESCYPMLFPWNLGYTLLWAKIPAFQFADLVGFQGLSGLVFLANAVVAWLWINRTPQSVSFSRRWRLTATAFFVSLILLYICGDQYGKIAERDFLPARASHFKALLVQANIGNFEKFWAEKKADFRIPIVDSYDRLTRSALNLSAIPDSGKADLVLWPETAFPDALDVAYLHGPNQQRFIRLVQDAHANFIVGGYSEDVRRQTSYNSIFQFDPRGNPIAKYHKRRLLAFGEYFPLSDTFPILKRLFPEIPDFNRGTDTTPMSMQIQGTRVPAALQICYEGLFPDLTSDFFKPEGSDIIVNVTNDSWYDAYFEPHQHMTMTLARAVEFRRPLLRVTNTGISTVMLSNGNKLVESPVGVEWTNIYDVPFISHAPLTLYTQICTLLPPLYWMILACAWIFFYFHRRKTQT